MKKMIRRLCAIVLSLAMVVTLMPQMSSAKERGDVVSIS